MSEPPRLERLDPTDARAVADYERAFYKAFRRETGNRLIRRLWVWDEAAGRVCARIPYGDQVIFVAREACGTIAWGFAVNTALKNFQSAAFGFSAPRAPNSAEALTFFTVENIGIGTTFRYQQASLEALLELGISDLYATCGPRPLQTYLWAGAERLDARSIEGEARYFLRFHLPKLMTLRTGRPRPHRLDPTVYDTNGAALMIVNPSPTYSRE